MIPTRTGCAYDSCGTCAIASSGRAVPLERRQPSRGSHAVARPEHLAVRIGQPRARRRVWLRRRSRSAMAAVEHKTTEKETMPSPSIDLECGSGAVGYGASPHRAAPGSSWRYVHADGQPPAVGLYIHIYALQRSAAVVWGLLRDISAYIYTHTHTGASDPDNTTIHAYIPPAIHALHSAVPCPYPDYASNTRFEQRDTATLFAVTSLVWGTREIWRESREKKKKKKKKKKKEAQLNPGKRSTMGKESRKKKKEKKRKEKTLNADPRQAEPADGPTDGIPR